MALNEDDLVSKVISRPGPRPDPPEANSLGVAGGGGSSPQNDLIIRIHKCFAEEDA